MSSRQTRYHPLFDSDLQLAYDWYDAQRDGLATEFLSEVRRGINNIQSDPTRFARINSDEHITASTDSLISSSLKPRQTLSTSMRSFIQFAAHGTPSAEWKIDLSSIETAGLPWRLRKLKYLPKKSSDFIC
ncbi:hypothetical protein Plim_2529 [Planctopirus limnophila DSM 3776]|uniref:Uncharacterized protein n=1 Tax=Planctopirus limnophila (strain ATCC 43296 / DSM 3776 / IFAM 1008 / Mu 290) TaxID=521674 RepID=D5SPX9_PLAL2|nr:hypothetical protein Plim_2529 [Planctopirus limnophila DSM 3776]